MKAWWLFAIPGVMLAQTEAGSDFNPLSARSRAVNLEAVSIFAGYYSSGAANGFEVPIQSPFLNGPSAAGGVAATLGGSKQGEKSTFTWTYSPSYFNIFYSTNQGANRGSLSHRGGMSWTRTLGNSNKWTVSSSLNGFIADLEQLYFSQSLVSSVAAFPTTFDDLAAAMLTGRFTDPQLASLLTGAPLQSSAEQGYLYGNRMLNLAANVGIAWAATGRTSISVNFSGARMQHLNGLGTSGTSINANPLFAPQTTNATAGISLSHSLSPRTQVGIEASSMRTFSRLQQGYATHSSFSVGRTLSRRWLVNARGGAGKLTYATQLYAAPKTVDYVYGAGLVFKTYSYTCLVSYDRSLGDSYGLGSRATSTGSAAWTWQRPGSNWSILLNGGYQELNNSTFQNTRSWRAGATVGRRLTAHLSMSTKYVYLELPVDLRAATGADITENGISISANWSPLGYR